MQLPQRQKQKRQQQQQQQLELTVEQVTTKPSAELVLELALKKIKERSWEAFASKQAAAAAASAGEGGRAGGKKGGSKGKGKRSTAAVASEPGGGGGSASEVARLSDVLNKHSGLYHEAFAEAYRAAKERVDK